MSSLFLLINAEIVILILNIYHKMETDDNTFSCNREVCQFISCDMVFHSKNAKTERNSKYGETKNGEQCQMTRNGKDLNILGKT